MGSTSPGARRHWTDLNGCYAPAGAQLEMWHFPRVEQFAVVHFRCCASHRPEMNKNVRRPRPDWGKDADEVIAAEVAFELDRDDIVLVLAHRMVPIKNLGDLLPHDTSMLFIQRFKPTVKFGWVRAYNLEVPFLLPQ